MIRDLRVIPPLMKQAMGNLTGNARDLWVAGIRNIEDQRANLDLIVGKVAEDASDELKKAIKAAENGNRWVRYLARRAGTVQDRAIRHRQGQLHLVPAKRPSRADDLGR